MIGVDRERGVWHEALTLPVIFLTVALLGGLRIDTAGRLGFMPPPLMALVLAVVLIGALYRSGALVPPRLLHPSRTGLANVSGVVVIVTLGLAASQVLGTLTPEGGLLALVFNVAWLVLLGNTVTARPDRSRLLASLLVVFGAAFIVKYVLLGALYAPEAGLTKRVVLALMEGVSLGALAYEPAGPATGYVAFVAVLLFLGGVAALPRGASQAGTALIARGVIVDDDLEIG
jgi:hypothetical protein